MTQRDTLAQAQLLVDSFVFHHRQAAIPALIGACVGWAVENGAADLVRASLCHAILTSLEAEAAWRANQS